MQKPYPCSLQAYNTLNIAASASELVAVADVDQLADMLATRAADIELVLGGGSNVVLTRDIDGLVLVNQIKGISSRALSDDRVLVRAAAGESWDHLVRYCVGQELWGIENLAAIPGTAGAAPIQNIGAYGVELDAVLHSVEVIARDGGQRLTLAAADCGLDYRDSHFKNKWRDQFIITAITLQLSRRPQPQLQYGELQKQLAHLNQAALCPFQVYDCVARIRAGKIPNPEITPNVGSFFKNPIISQIQFQRLQQSCPDIVYYPVSDNRVKLAAGWLLERAGWKNRPQGSLAMHQNQALVMINNGGATGGEVAAYAAEIQRDILSRFAVSLEIEPNMI